MNRFRRSFLDGTTAPWLILFFACSTLCGRAYAESGYVLIQVKDAYGNPLKGVTIEVEGSGGSDTSDAEGRMKLRLGPETRPGMKATIGLIQNGKSKPYAMIEPFEPWIIVPSFANEANNFVTVTLVRQGDKLILSKRLVVSVIASEIAQSTASTSSQISAPAASYRSIAAHLGLPEADIEHAVAKLALTSADPYGQGMAEMARGNFSDAQAKLGRSYEIRSDLESADREDLFNAAYNFGLASYASYGYKEALRGYSAASAIQPEDARATEGVGIALAANDRFPEALEKLRLALKQAEASLGAGSSAVAPFKVNLASVLIQTQQFGEAKTLVAAVQKASLSQTGPDSNASSDSNLLKARLDLEQVRVIRSAANQSIVTIGPGYAVPELTNIMSMDDYFKVAGELSEAQTLTITALRTRQKNLESPNIAIATAQQALGDVLLETGDALGAAQCFNSAIGQTPRTNPYQAILLGRVGSAEVAQGDLEGAEKRLDEAQRLTSEQLGPASLQYAQVIYALALVLAQKNRRADALNLLDECLAIETRILGQNNQLAKQTSIILRTLKATDRLQPNLFRAQKSRPRGALDLTDLCATASDH